MDVPDIGIYSYVARIIGTVLGLIAGVAAWYIGTQRQDINNPITWS